MQIAPPPPTPVAALSTFLKPKTDINLPKNISFPLVLSERQFPLLQMTSRGLAWRRTAVIQFLVWPSDSAEQSTVANAIIMAVEQMRPRQ